MESPISRSCINDFTFNQMIKDAKMLKIQDTLKKIGEFESVHQREILDKVLQNTSKMVVQSKFKALKNAGKSLQI